MGFTGKTEEFLDTVVANNGFFPTLELSHFQSVYRVPAEYETQAVIEEVNTAKNNINFIMQVQQEVWTLNGFATLEEVIPDHPSIELPALYRESVYCWAKAELLKQFETFVRKESAENLAKESDETYDHWLARSRRSTRRMLGMTTVTVELI